MITLLAVQQMESLARSISILRQTVDRRTYDEVIDRALTVVEIEMSDLQKGDKWR